MEKAIRTLNVQFAYKPEIINKKNLKKRSGFIVAGMGGSALSAGLLKDAFPSLGVMIHRNYGLPNVSSKELKNHLFIASSYSGNTEEVIDALSAARKAKLAVAVVATGGKLLKIAIDNKLPYIQMPDHGIQPRMALGFSCVALLKLMGKEAELRKISALASLDSDKFETAGRNLAGKLLGKIPVVYASDKNGYLAYTWKIKFNETAKVPAFYNVFPELNHNEMVGFSGEGEAKKITEKFFFLFLRDKKDDPRVRRRMEVLEDVFKNIGMDFAVIDSDGKNDPERIFSSLMLADWVTYYLAYKYGVDPEAVPLVERFKKLL